MTPPPSRLSEERLREIERAAGEATPGPWEHRYENAGNGVFHGLQAICRYVYSHGHEGKEGDNRNARFISLANPATVAQMARELREANERVSALEQLVVCYRVGKRPSEKLLAELDRTRKALEET
jgi:hypothetical protein